MRRAVDLGWNYPAGLEHDPRAPWNEPPEDEPDEGICPRPSRYCRCNHCQTEMADLAEEF